jgi:hypothetical protein
MNYDLRKGRIVFLMSQKTYDRLIHSHRGLIAGTMRDVILPAILGKETDGILYWIGKDLAREYPVASLEDLIVLTEQLGMENSNCVKKTQFSMFGV